MINQPVSQVCENQMIVCCFDSTVQYGKHTILPLVVKCHHMTLSPWDLTTPIVLRFPNSLIVFPTERSGLQRRPQDFSRILGFPHKFLKFVVKCLFSGPSSSG